MEKLTTTLVLIALCLFIAAPNASAKSIGKEKVARIHFYVHNNGAGSVNATVYIVANASISDSSPTEFGSVRVLDDLLTAGPEVNSTEVGRVQGMITRVDFKVFAVALNLNYIFTSGKYNGSTLTIAGRYDDFAPKRELAIIGGTGFFRLARGYAISTFFSFNATSGYAIDEYNMFVLYPKHRIDL